MLKTYKRMLGLGRVNIAVSFSGAANKFILLLSTVLNLQDCPCWRPREPVQFIEAHGHATNAGYVLGTIRTPTSYALVAVVAMATPHIGVDRPKTAIQPATSDNAGSNEQAMVEIARLHLASNNFLETLD